MTTRQGAFTSALYVFFEFVRFTWRSENGDRTRVQTKTNRKPETTEGRGASIVFQTNWYCLFVVSMSSYLNPAAN